MLLLTMWQWQRLQIYVIADHVAMAEVTDLMQVLKFRNSA
jgi:hypothetical protein